MFYSKIPESSPFNFDRLSHTAKNGELKFEPHYHNYFEIYYVEKGSCDYFIDNKAYHLTAGDLVLIPEGIIHNTLYRESNESARLLINCARHYIPVAAEKVFSKRSYMYRNHDITGKLLEILNKIGDEFFSPDVFSDDVIKCYMRLFFFTMARNPNRYENEAFRSGYVETAINYIQENLSSEISLSEIAGKFSISPEHFSRQFKKETGFGFCEYVSLLRLKRAETLLKQPENMSVAQIAAECGFSDSNYFSVRFKKMYGISPKALQKISREI